MINWEERLKPVPSPSIYVDALNVLFILIIIFMLSSNFIFLPGIKSRAALPELPGAEIIQANKLIVTISFKADGEQAGSSQKFEYTFNGNKAETLDDIKSDIKKTLDNVDKETANRTSGGNAESPIILLHADKGIPLQELVNCYAKLREYNAMIVLATDFEKEESTIRIQQAKGN